MRISRRVSWFWVLVTAVASVWVGISVVAWMNGELTGTSMRLGAEIDLARKAGLPIEPSEVEKAPAVTDKDNAAPHILRAVEELRNVSAPARRALDGPTYGQAPSEADWLALKPLLSQFDPVALELHQAAGMPSCDFRRNYKLGWDLMFPELSSMRRVTKLLTSRARFAAEQGRVDDAFDELEVCARLTVLIGRAPDIVSWHTAAHAQASTLEGFHVVLGVVPIGQHVLDRSKRLLKMLEEPADLRNAYRSDLVMRRISLAQVPRQDPAQLSLSMWPKELSNPVLRSSTGLRALEARLVSVSRRIYQQLPMKSEDWPRAKEAIDKLELEESVQRGASRALSRQAALMAKDSVRAYGAWIAYYRLAWTAVRLLEIRVKTGKLPVSLEPEASCIDPFVREPFEYRLTPRGFKVYGVGTDSGGGARVNAPLSNGYDIVFEVPLGHLTKP